MGTTLAHLTWRIRMRFYAMNLNRKLDYLFRPIGVQDIKFYLRKLRRDASLPVCARCGDLYRERDVTQYGLCPTCELLAIRDSFDEYP